MIAETDSLGSRLKTYLYGDDLISQTESTNTKNTFHYDGLGLRRLLSSDVGEQSDTYNYLAFGELQHQIEGYFADEFVTHQRKRYLA